MQDSLYHLAMLLRFHRDAEQLGIQSYAARAPRTLTSKLEESFQRYNTVCDGIENQLVMHAFVCDFPYHFTETYLRRYKLELPFSTTWQSRILASSLNYRHLRYLKYLEQQSLPHQAFPFLPFQNHQLKTPRFCQNSRIRSTQPNNRTECTQKPLSQSSLRLIKQRPPCLTAMTWKTCLVLLREHQHKAATFRHPSLRMPLLLRRCQCKPALRVNSLPGLPERTMLSTSKLTESMIRLL